MREVGGRGGGPSLHRRGEKAYGKDTASSGPGGPLPDLSAYTRQPARCPTMLAHLVAMLAYVGLCWPMLAYLAGNVGPAWGYVGLAWGYVGLS